MAGMKKGINDLATLYPEIAAQWDHEKNQGLLPSDVMPGSGKRVWWICCRGHSWRTAVYHRKEGHGCPYCTALDSAVKKGKNDLTAIHPELVQEWDWEKNIGYQPDAVAHTSQLQVWWRCEKGHSWKTTVNKRACRKQGCPYCSGIKVLAGFNDLETTMPELAAQWDHEKNGDLTPADVMAGTDRKVWWRCREGHSWEAMIYSRKNGNGCPYCAGNILVKGKNDLATADPDLLLEWDYEKNREVRPDSIAANSTAVVWWKCRNGHGWKAAVYSRHAGKGCPYCANRKILPGYNDLAATEPELLKEWDYRKNTVRPEHISRASRVRVWWKCCEGHSWKTSPASRSSGTGCPYCKHKEVLPGFNDLASLHPGIGASWDQEKNGGITPDMIAPYSAGVFWWKCKRGHSWKTSVSNRMSCGCPYCANRKVLPGYNDLQSRNPALAREWDHDGNAGLRPDEVTFRQRKQVLWICEKGHRWRAEVYERSCGAGCPYCNNKRVLAGFNDLKTAFPELMEDWDYERNVDISPDEIFPYTNRKVWWLCENGHHYRSTVNSHSQGSGCPYCYGHLPTKMRFVP